MSSIQTCCLWLGESARRWPVGMGESVPVLQSSRDGPPAVPAGGASTARPPGCPRDHCTGHLHASCGRASGARGPPDENRWLWWSALPSPVRPRPFLARPHWLQGRDGFWLCLPCYGHCCGCGGSQHTVSRIGGFRPPSSSVIARGLRGPGFRGGLAGSPHLQSCAGCAGRAGLSVPLRHSPPHAPYPGLGLEPQGIPARGLWGCPRREPGGCGTCSAAVWEGPWALSRSRGG